MPEDTYELPRNVAEAERLEEQGRWVETALNYMIHPDLAAGLPNSPKVADVGTGTGGFLVRLSEKYPASSSFYGFDMSSNQFRSKSDIPVNVQLHVQDVKKSFPAELHNQFDLVHLRFLVFGLDKDDWAIATRNALELLRPGGSIQWLEPDIITQKCLRGGPAGSPFANLRYAWSVLDKKDQYPRTQYGFNILPGIFEAAGLEGVTQDIVASDRVATHREKASHVSLTGLMSLLKKSRETGAPEPYEQRSIEDVEQKAREDIEKGAYMRADYYCTIGRKPRATSS